MWEELQGELQIANNTYPGYRFIPISSDSTLDQFEHSYAIKLPESYREFVSKFGAGELAEFYRIAALLPVENDYNLDTFNSRAYARLSLDSARICGNRGPKTSPVLTTPSP